jgi:hypothetical protein
METTARQVRGGFLLAILAALVMAGLPLATIVFQLPFLDSLPARLAWLLVSAVPGGALLKLAARRRRASLGWGLAWALAAALGACLHVILAYLPAISDYPLTLGWSETSRYYYASLFYARSIYGFDAPPTVLHPSRYFLQSLPYLIPGSTLLVHRAWQVFLWLVMPALFCAALLRRLPVRPWPERLAVSAAVFLLLMAGPVYYHLLVPAIIILFGFDAAPQQVFSRRWWLNLLALTLASAWAGVSRINWFPVPAMLAAALVFIQQPLPDRTPAGLARYAGRILALGVWGTGAAFIAQAGYILWSGNAAEEFTTSFTSDLLWSRLLPNPTFAPGILLATVLISLPTALLVLARLWGGWRRLHWLRLLGLAAMLLVLLAGGLVVSVKIGGGSNIHNIDAYLVMLAVVGVLFYYGRGQSESGQPKSGQPGRLLHAGAVLALLLPAMFAMLDRGVPQPLPERDQAERAVREIAQAARSAAKQGGDTLFLTNRHLLTFGMVKGVRLVPEYERVFLMEAAMSRDPRLLGRLHEQLRTHAWALIVSEPLSTLQKGSDDMFGAENDVWVKEVARYILCYYEPSVTLRPTRVQLLVPRAQPRAECP